MSAEQDAYEGTDTPEWNRAREMTLRIFVPEARHDQGCSMTEDGQVRCDCGLTGPARDGGRDG